MSKRWLAAAAVFLPLLFVPLTTGIAGNLRTTHDTGVSDRIDEAIPADAFGQPTVAVVPNVGISDIGKHGAILSPDGRILASYSDSRVKLWDFATGRLLRTLQHRAFFLAVSFLPDGTRVITTHKDGSVRLWNVETGISTNVLRNGNPSDTFYQSTALLADENMGWLLFDNAGKTVSIWDIKTRKEIYRFNFSAEQTALIAVRISADHRRLLAAGVNELKIFDISSQRVLRHIKLPGGYSFEEDSLFSDTVFTVTGETNDPQGKPCALRTLKLLRLANPVNLETLDAPSICNQPEGDTTSGAPRTFFDAARHQLLITREHMPGAKYWDLQTGEISPALTWLVNVAGDIISISSGVVITNEAGVIRARGLKNGELIREFRSYGDETRKTIAGNGRQILFEESRNGYKATAVSTLLRWQAGNPGPEEQVKIKGGTLILDISTDGAAALASINESTLAELSLKDGSELRRFDLPLTKIVFAQFLPDGASAAVFGEDASEKEMNLIADLKTGRVRLNLAHFVRQGGLTAAAVSADGSKAAAGYWDGSVAIWDISTGKLLTSFVYGDNDDLNSAVFALAFSPDGKFIIGGHRDIGVTVWALSPRRPVRTLKIDNIAGYVNTASVAMSRDGKAVIAGLAERARSSGDVGAERAIRVWDVETGKLLHNLTGPEAGVAFAAFSASDRQIIGASYDGTIRYWDRETGELIALTTSAQRGWLTITRSGFFAASEDAAGNMISVVRGLETYSVMQFYEKLHRPDLVEAVLKGDPEGQYKDAAFHLNLDKIIDSGPVPQIEHLKDRDERIGNSIRISLRLTGTGGGIGSRLVWKVNGVTQGDTTPAALANLEGPLGSATVTETLQLVPGSANVIEVTAYNNAGLLATPPFEITIDKFGVTTGARPRLFVLALGVDKYRMKEFQLGYAAADATSFAKALKVVGSTLFSEIPTSVLTDEEVSETRISDAMSQIAKSAKPEDVFVLFLGGHGKSIAGRYYYYPQALDFAAHQTVEQNGIGQDKWEAWLAKIPVQKSLLVIDTCEGDAFRGSRGGGSVRETAMAQLEHATGRNIISAARDAAYEGYRGHGVLTYALLEALDISAAHGGEKEVRVTSLADYVEARVPEITRSSFGVAQFPSHKLTGINFPIGIREAVFESVGGQSVIPREPTHIVIRAELVRAKPSANAEVNGELSAGTRVRAIESYGSWVLIARDGQKLGYLPSDAIVVPH